MSRPETSHVTKPDSGQPTSQAAQGPSAKELRSAEVQDVPAAAQTVARAFAALDASAWLVPDPDRRLVVLSEVFAITLEHALVHGRVDLAFRTPMPRVPATGVPAVTSEAAAGPDPVGVAVWFNRTRPLPPPAQYEQRLWEFARQDYPSFAELNLLFDTHHSDGPHHHLALLAVRPGHQGQGIGARLLRAHHERLDTTGLPSYLEAADEDSARLYQRHGYQPHGQQFRFGPRAVFTPMWRNPVPHADPGDHT